MIDTNPNLPETPDSMDMEPLKPNLEVGDQVAYTPLPSYTRYGTVAQLLYRKRENWWRVKIHFNHSPGLFSKEAWVDPEFVTKRLK